MNEMLQTSLGMDLSGFNEIQYPPKRYTIIGRAGLRELLDLGSPADLAAAYRGWIDEMLGKGALRREGRWTESIAVGSELFVNATQAKLGLKGRGRDVVGEDGSYELRESPVSYRAIVKHENNDLRPQNRYFWNDPGGLSGA